ncbi:MAG: hypothetical protein ACJ8E1_17710 [Xanthobacteraceae bacterium]
MQQLQFLDHVCASNLVLQARAFDFEDRDLVDQFSPRYGDLRSFHPDLSELMHLDAVCSTTATSMVLAPMSLLAAAAEIRKRRRRVRLGDLRTSAAAQEVSSASYLDDRFHETDHIGFPGFSRKMGEFRVSHMIRILEALV